MAPLTLQKEFSWSMFFCQHVGLQKANCACLPLSLPTLLICAGTTPTILVPSVFGTVLAVIRATAVHVVTFSSPGTVQPSCQHIIVSSHNSTSREFYRPVSRVPQTIVSVIDHRSDTTVTHVSCVDQEYVSTADSNSVFRAGLLVRKCLSYMLMSPRRSTLAPVPTTVGRLRRHHKRRWTNVPVPAGITRPKLQHTYSRAFVLKPLPPDIKLQSATCLFSATHR